MKAIWRWFFPTAADRVARARQLLEAGRPAEARAELLDNADPAAGALLVQAEQALVQVNLTEALASARNGDLARAQEHLAMAEAFHHGGQEERFRDARRELREIRQEQQEAAARREADQASATLVVTGPTGAAAGDPFSDAERDELANRLALVVEGYPQELRAEVGGLGSTFAAAVLDLQEARPDLALPALSRLNPDHPLVAWELSRAAEMLGDPRAALEALRRLQATQGVRKRFAGQHIGEATARLLASTGDLPGAIKTLRSVRADEPEVGGFLLAQLLEATGDWTGADRLLTQLCRQHPNEPILNVVLARVRVAGGDRSAAMQALEASLVGTCCTPGKCGTRAPSPDVLRPLATLYYEDRRDLARADELLAQLASLKVQPTAEDAYLRSLAAQAHRRPEAPALAAELLARLPDGPLRQRAERYLGAEA
jgi:hypothetical protein